MSICNGLCIVIQVAFVAALTSCGSAKTTAEPDNSNPDSNNPDVNPPPLPPSAPGETADPGATAETKALFANLRAITEQQSQSSILFGMEGATLGGYFNSADEELSDGVQSDIRTVTGKGPAVLGIDVAMITGDWWDPNSTEYDYAAVNEETRNKMRNHVRLQHARGGIIEMAWHQSNPAGGFDNYGQGPFEMWRIATPAACASLESQFPEIADQCGVNFGVFKDKIDELSDWYNTLKDDQNRSIPVIFRPFHENTLHSFWWGSAGEFIDGQWVGVQPMDRYTAVFRAVWSWMFNYMIQTKGVHNLLWTIAPNGAGGCPGDSLTEERYLAHSPEMGQVDILGYDFYSGRISNGGACEGASPLVEIPMIVALARENGKIAAYTEAGWPFGYQDQLESGCEQNGALTDFWSEGQIKPVIEIGGMAWMMTWSTNVGGNIYGPVPGNCTGDDFKKLHDDHIVLLEGEGPGGVAFDYYSLH